MQNLPAFGQVSNARRPPARTRRMEQGGSPSQGFVRLNPQYRFPVKTGGQKPLYVAILPSRMDNSRGGRCESKPCRKTSVIPVSTVEEREAHHLRSLLPGLDQ